MYLTNQELFSNLFDPDRFELLLTIGETLNKIGVNTINTKITEIISLDYSDDGKRDDILSEYSETLISVLSQYGVRINVEKYSDIYSLHELLLLILRIEQDENHEDILAITEAEDEPVQVIVNLSEYLKELSWIEILELVESVHPILIERIKEKHTVVDTDDFFDEIDVYRERFINYLKRLNLTSDKDVIFNLVSLQYGYGLTEMLNILNDDLLTLPAPQMARNLKLIALGSNTPDDEIYGYLERWVTRHVDNPAKAIEITALLK